MSDIVGTPRKVIIDGIPYRVFADANFDEKPSRYENKAIATSGGALRQMTAQVPTKEGITVACNGLEYNLLKAVAEGTDDVAMSATMANGDTFRCTGWIDLEKRETETGKATLKMFPRDDWELFIA